MSECMRPHFGPPLELALAIAEPASREAFLSWVRDHGERRNADLPERAKLFNETHPPEAEPEELPKP